MTQRSEAQDAQDAQDALPTPADDPACAAWLAAIDDLQGSPLADPHLPPLPTPPEGACAQTWASDEGQQALLRCATNPRCEAALRAALLPTPNPDASSAPAASRLSPPDAQAQARCEGFAQIATAQASRCEQMGEQLEAWLTVTEAARGEGGGAGDCGGQWRTYSVSTALVGCLSEPRVQRALEALLRSESAAP